MRPVTIFQQFHKKLLSILFLTLCASVTFAQPILPQRTITLQAIQTIDFGKFFVTGANGTITVGYDGAITSDGIIFLSSSTSHPAIFNLKLCQGRQVRITYDATTILTSNGSTLTMDMGATEHGISGSSFLTNSDCNFITTLRMGGTLHIPKTAIPGTYSGPMSITLTQE